MSKRRRCEAICALNEEEYIQVNLYYTHILTNKFYFIIFNLDLRKAAK